MQGKRPKDHLREEIEEGMSFYSNVTPRRFGAGRPKDKPVEQESKKDDPYDMNEGSVFEGAQDVSIPRAADEDA